MHIVYGKDQADSLRDRYTVLELDTIDVKEVSKSLTAYAVVDPSNMGLEKLDFNQLANWTKLHESLIENIKKQNKDFCLDAIEHLKGQFGGELDSFYVNVEERFND
jgi:hypothetical protein